MCNNFFFFLIFLIKFIDSSASEDFSDVDIEDIDGDGGPESMIYDDAVKIVENKKKKIYETRIPTRKKAKEDPMVKYINYILSFCYNIIIDF